MPHPTSEMLVIPPITPESSSPAITSAPTHVPIAIQKVDGVTQVVRKLPLAGLENMAIMKASATGSTAAARPSGGGTGVSGTRVKMLGTRPG